MQAALTVEAAPLASNVQLMEAIMPAPTPAVNTFELQRAIRDDRSLSSSDKLTLHTLATYLPTVHPSVKTLARGAALDIKTVRQSIKRLVAAGWLHLDVRPGRTTLYTLTPAKRHPYQTAPVVPNGCTQTASVHPYQTAPVVPNGCTQTASVHPYQTAPAEETRKRQEQETNNQTDCKTAQISRDSHADCLVELDSDLLVEEQAVMPPPIPDTPSTWMSKWAEVWGKVCGQIPMPPEAQIKALHCDELRFAAALARVASMKHGGQLRSARKAFFGTLRKLAEKEDHEISAWTPAGVLQELEGEKVKTSTVPYHRPAAPVTPELTEEQREANRAVMRQWVMTPSGDFLHVDSPEYQRYKAALERRGVMS